MITFHTQLEIAQIPMTISVKEIGGEVSVKNTFEPC